MRKPSSIAIAVAFAFTCGCAHAQVYPSRPVRMVVPFPPGGSTDIVARLLAQKMAERLRQQVIVDNRGGAGGSIGAHTVARATPDGYTIMLTNPGPSVHNVLLRMDASYAIRDFASIVHIASSSSVVVANAKFPAGNLKELIALAKAKPGTIKWASAGVNSNPHISLEVLRSATGIDVVHVPYKGSGAALTDTAAGEVDAMFTSIIASEPFVTAGRLKVLGYAGDKRAAALPHVATFVEQGVLGAVAANWIALVAASNVPRPIVAKLNETVNEVLQAPDVRSRFAQNGLEIAGGPPERLDALIKAEAVRITHLVKSGALRVEN